MEKYTAEQSEAVYYERKGEERKYKSTKRFFNIIFGVNTQIDLLFWQNESTFFVYFHSYEFENKLPIF